MSNNKIRIRLKAYDHRLLDAACGKILETVKRTGGEISGPVPLPTEVEKITVLRAVHKYKGSHPQRIRHRIQPSNCGNDRKTAPRK